MAINLKAKETLIQVGELKGKYRYVLSTELYNKLPESKVIKEAALRSGVSRGVMQACWMLPAKLSRHGLPKDTPLPSRGWEP